MSLTPFGTDIWRNGDISFEIPSKEVIHAHAASGVTETSVSKESDFCMLSPMPLTPQSRARRVHCFVSRYQLNIRQIICHLFIRLFCLKHFKNRQYGLCPYLRKISFSI